MTSSMTHLIDTGAPAASVRSQTSIGRDTELDSYSIEEFCRRNSISRGTYFNMKAAGTGPREKRAMGRVLVTKEAAQEWRSL
jgi:hypothetical protein